MAPKLFADAPGSGLNFHEFMLGRATVFNVQGIKVRAVSLPCLLHRIESAEKEQT
jgi:hypothetical protein